MSRHADHDPVTAARTHADRERARADAAGGLAKLQAASLAEMARYAEELRCQISDLTTDAHTLCRCSPYPPDGLRYVTERMARMADTMARAAAGYARARESDMAYPTILADLEAHGWIARPDHELDGILPPIPITELRRENRGYRRGWSRGTQTLTFWFTGPYALAYAHASGRGRLHDTTEVHAVITSSPDGTLRGGEGARSRCAADRVPFDANFTQVAEYLRAAGWGEPRSVDRCDERGIHRANGRGTSAEWHRPGDPDFRLNVWGVDDEPAHVRYWAGPVTDLGHLERIIRHR
ncbi:hypothetical protein [Prauserella muralis]|uniref:Uncharacterized protein n=1 Tax=Prauserella muralis TaxID=588067 RepID=A0A2V4AXP0_9PSEU|nr:hypothetical protein [Prauserella muralis]PXY25434.1 hypothetical protein BAY60_18850 [Prauserella muralis]TWE27555.1 hypothetical protein FHX69_0191 [Prauserella muralis]